MVSFKDTLWFYEPEGSDDCYLYDDREKLGFREWSTWCVKKALVGPVDPQKAAAFIASRPRVPSLLPVPHPEVPFTEEELQWAARQASDREEDH